MLKVTPAHDKADYEIGQRHALPMIDIMNPDGTMNDLAGEDFAGLDRFEARVEAVEKLRELGILVARNHTRITWASANARMFPSSRASASSGF